MELHNPGIGSLHLSPSVAMEWKQRALTTTARSAGSAGETQKKRSTGLEVLAAVRAFYLDIAEWALEDPAQWGPWAAPCPIRRNDELSRKKELSHRKAKMDQRTRERLPVLPALAASANAQRKASGNASGRRGGRARRAVHRRRPDARRSVLAIGSKR